MPLTNFRSWGQRLVIQKELKLMEELNRVRPDAAHLPGNVPTYSIRIQARRVGADNREPAISMVHMLNRSFIFDFLLFFRVSPGLPVKVGRENGFGLSAH